MLGRRPVTPHRRETSSSGMPMVSPRYLNDLFVFIEYVRNSECGPQRVSSSRDISDSNIVTMSCVCFFCEKQFFYGIKTIKFLPTRGIVYFLDILIFPTPMILPGATPRQERSGARTKGYLQDRGRHDWGWR